MSKRSVRSAPDENFESPNLLHYTPLAHRDISMVQSLADDLEKVGVLDREGEQLVADGAFSDILAEAAAGAQYEKELNSDYYRPEVEALVSKREKDEIDWENPDLVGVDAFGQPIDNGSRLTREQRLRFESEDEEDAIDMIMNAERNSRF